MIDIFSFVILLCFIILQRIVELFIAKSNEKWMKQQGAIEFGERHYAYMVSMHILFFIVFTLEKIWLNRGLSTIWPVFLSFFGLAQFLRVWAITSLGKYWNTRILVLENAKVIRKGPYRFFKHPNYLVVAVELLVIPMVFNAIYTAGLFTLLNVIMLRIRIPEEEKALRSLTEYEGTFQDLNRFIPKIVK